MRRWPTFVLALVVAAGASVLLDRNLREEEAAEAARSAAFQARDSAGPKSPLAGAWRAREYRLKDGAIHPVEGRIFFTDSEWLVLFFVMDAAERPGRGSAEGGSYTLEGEELVFAHRWNLSAGQAMAELAESPLRMEVRGAAEAPTEATRIVLEGDGLTLLFPSGNAMSFRRSS